MTHPPVPNYIWHFSVYIGFSTVSTFLSMLLEVSSIEKPIGTFYGRYVTLQPLKEMLDRQFKKSAAESYFKVILFESVLRN